jgi:chromate transporter
VLPPPVGIGATATFPSLGALAAYFVRLGALGFGGPIALTGAMHRDLVERRRWLSESQYLEGLALAQLAPGPLAAQLAIYIGWLRGGTIGAAAIGIAFVTPSFLMVLAIAAAYTRFGGLPGMQAAFYGIGAAVIAIICRSAVKLIRLTISREPVVWMALSVNAIATALFEKEFVWLIVAGGLAVLAARNRPPGTGRSTMLAILPIAAPVSGWLAPTSPVTLFWFFAKAGALVFGSGLAIVPFLYDGVVRDYAWLDDQQFLDAVAVAMITPGPVVITVAFIGFLAAGWTGSVAAALGVFLPCWLFVVIPAPYFQRFAAEPRLKALIDGVTAGASGAILGAALVLGRRAIVDLTTFLIFAATLAALVWLRRVPEPIWILVVGLGSIIWRG